MAIRRSYLPGVEATEAVSSVAFTRHTHDRFGVGLIRAGAQRSASGRGLVEAGPGDVITVNPGEVHDGAPLGGPRAWSMLYFAPSILYRAADEAGLASSASIELHHPVLRDEMLARIFPRVFALVTEASAAPMERDQAQCLLLAALLNGHASSPRSRRKGSVAIASARQLMDRDPAAPTSLADLAAVVGASRYQLVRGFVRETGLTPHAYRRGLRVRLARSLIQSGAPLADAAAAAGFVDQSHMHRAFLGHTGTTPGAWAAAAQG